MPRLIVLNAAGASQRRLLSEVLTDLKKSGFVLASRQEGGEWVELFGNSRTTGLFENRTVVQVEEASRLGKFPGELEGFLEGIGAPSVLLLLYSGDASKFFARELFKKLDVRRAREVPRWANQRRRWISEEVRRLGASVTSEAASLLAEWIEDGEELCSELEKLVSVAGGKAVDGNMVRLLTVDEGGRDLLNLLDGLCYAKQAQVVQALDSLRRGGVLLRVVVSLHNRFRLAMYQTSGNAGEGKLYLEALGARPYQVKMAAEAARRYDRGVIRAFVLGLVRLSLAEKTGHGRGWHDLCHVILKFLSQARR